jgi:dolichyl-phosphate beta-glucosyltransferase|tara:strand:- start:2056 stop:2796 length:741 start_codon:yes stop_codon:yes gene_type:complete
MENQINQLSLVIPCKNDEKTLIKKIPYLIDFCKNYIKNFEILIILNGGDETSTLELSNFIENHNIQNIELITINTVGKGAAVKMGLNSAKYNNILISDADFSVGIDHILKFLDEKGDFLGDFVVGSRKMKTSNISKTPFSRIITGFVYTALVKSLLGISVSDTQCGFKVINIQNFKTCKDFTKEGFSYDVELFFLAKQEEIKVMEIPVDYIHDEKSNVSISSDTITMAKDLLMILWEYRIRKLLKR